MAITYEEVLLEATKQVLQNPANLSLSPDELKGKILDECHVQVDAHNAMAPKGCLWKIPSELKPFQVAHVMLEVHKVALIETGVHVADEANMLLGVYMTEGYDEGLYITNNTQLRRIARQYKRTLTKKEMQEVCDILREEAPRVKLCLDRKLIAVNNGIFDFDTKQLLPFTPEKVFLSKARVNYNPNAVNLVIHNSDDNTDWDVESWVEELSDDPEIVNSLWEVIGAIIRPNVSWRKACFMYSESGNNGKGTLCSLMRNLVGEGSYTSIPLADFGKDFMLEPLIHATAVIVDENDVGLYLDKAANLKAVITNDTVQVNRKFQMPVSFKYHGFMVQCLNEMPRIKDKSDSFYRRQLFIPFTKCFTGVERKYIKDDYLKRTEVLEYVLYRVLHMSYYELSTPKACKDALAEYCEL